MKVRMLELNKYPPAHVNPNQVLLSLNRAKLPQNGGADTRDLSIMLAGTLSYLRCVQAGLQELHSFDACFIYLTSNPRPLNSISCPSVAFELIPRSTHVAQG